jgi:hypothetical protein
MLQLQLQGPGEGNESETETIVKTMMVLHANLQDDRIHAL